MGGQMIARYKIMKQALTDLLDDMSILSGKKVGPSNVSWHDIAETAMGHAQLLADQLVSAYLGNAEPFITFPSPSECMKGDDDEN